MLRYMLVDSKKIEIPLAYQILELIDQSGVSFAEAELALRAVRWKLPKVTFINLRKSDELRESRDQTVPVPPSS